MKKFILIALLFPLFGFGQTYLAKSLDGTGATSTGALITDTTTRLASKTYLSTIADRKTDKLITAVRKTQSDTLELSDADKLIEMNVGSANNLTIPPHSSVAFPIGTQILIAQYGSWTNSSVGDNFTDGVIYGLADSIYAGDDNFKIEIKSGSGIVIGDDNSNISFGGSKHLNSLNNISGISNVTFSGAIDGSLWSNGITIPLHPELYSTYAKQIIKASNGSVYTRYFNGATDVITIIN